MKPCLLFLLGFLIATTSLSAGEPPAPRLRAGAATANITPALGRDLIGNFLPITATHVHDELHVRCLVLDDGRTRLALVVCDLLGIDRAVSDEARRLIQQSTGLPPEQVLISATHTHSAASALGANRFKGPQPLDEYQRFVAGRIADGVRCAINTLRPAQVAFVTADAPEHLFNRRWHMKPGTIPPNPFGDTELVRMNPPAGSPDLIEPAGPIDPAVSVLALREPDGRPIAIFSAYSLHYVGDVGPGHISADYFGIYCRELERRLGAERQDPPFVAIMANGTSGDINNTSFRVPRPRQPAYSRMRAVAEDVAKKVHEALAHAEYRDHATLAARYRELPITTRRPTPELLEWAKRTVADPSQSGGVNLPLLYARRTLNMAEHPEVIPLPLQLFRIGEVCIGTMPVEIFCETGLAFKERSPLKPALLVSLAHGYYGYLPTPRHHELGGYETWLGTSRFEPQASEKLLEALLKMAAQVRDDTRR